MVGITISNGDETDTDSDRGMVVITISSGDDVNTDSDRGDDGVDHHQLGRCSRRRQRAW